MSNLQSSSQVLLAALANFDQLPDSADVKISVVAGLYSCSPATVWRHVKTGLIPPPVKRLGGTRWVVGTLRAARAAST